MAGKKVCYFGTFLRQSISPLFPLAVVSLRYPLVRINATIVQAGGSKPSCSDDPREIVSIIRERPSGHYCPRPWQPGCLTWTLQKMADDKLDIRNQPRSLQAPSYFLFASGPTTAYLLTIKLIHPQGLRVGCRATYGSSILPFSSFSPTLRAAPVSPIVEPYGYR